MDTHPSYYILYKTLELPHDASSEQLRLHYRRLAQRTHPDAPGGDNAAFQTISNAYETLRRYHLLHGEMPLNHLSINHASISHSSINKASTDKTPTNQVTRPSRANPSIKKARHKGNRAKTPQQPAGIRRHPLKTHSLLRRHASTLTLSAVTLAALWHLFDRPASPTPPKPAPTVQRAQNVTVAMKTFSLGASITDVVDAQGVPDTSENGIWTYGRSRVFFYEGKVAGWDDAPESPLNLTRELSAPVQPTFSVGDSTRNVLNAQGVPNHVSENEWRYGLSSIYFRHNRVTGWHEDPANPLAAAEKPTNR